jgi:hypothetical protein
MQPKPSITDSGLADERSGHKLFFGLLQRRPCVIPTRRGLLVVLAMAFAAIVVILCGLPPFLSVNAPVDSSLLIVEGWLPDYALKTTIEMFHNGHYQKLYVTGVPIEEGAPLSEYHSLAELGAAVIIHQGMETNLVQAVPAPEVLRNRTYASAMALKRWFDQHGIVPGSMNIISMGPHARRTRLLYQMAFGAQTRVGIIPLPDRSFKDRSWWKTSEGLKETITEFVAYIYARFFFSPPAG